MKMSRRLVILAMAIPFIIWSACDEDSPSEPNDLGGETDLELTRVGNVFPIYINNGHEYAGLNNLRDSIYITKNDNGIVTMHGKLTFDTALVRGLEEMLGVSDLPDSFKRSVLDTYVERFGARLDTTDKDNMTADVELQLKITSEGIQEFHSSGGDISRPFTIVKYDAAVGDKYEFTNSDGVKITRTVVSKSVEDDFEVGYWLLKVIKVEEVKDDPLTESVTYITNHKYGLVGIESKMINGKEVGLVVYPPTL